MKTSLFVGAAFAILGLAATPLSAQTQTTTTATSSGYLQTSKIIGTKVKTTQGEEIGVVKDVVLDRSTGCMAYTVLSAGGTGTRITGQAKTVAVPWAVYSTTSEPSVLTVTVDRDRIYNAPAFDYARISEYSTSGYINNVYSYYGVSAGGVSGQTSVTGTATTGTATTATGTTSATGTTTTGATASPMASASPAATAAGAYGASPAATASPGATASAAASPTASVAASPMATASPRGTRGAGREETTTGRARTGMSPAGSPSEEMTTGKPKAGMSPAASPRRHAEGVREKAEESPAETTGSSSEGKKARRHRGEETAEPSASPRTTEEQE